MAYWLVRSTWEDKSYKDDFLKNSSWSCLTTKNQNNKLLKMRINSIKVGDLIFFHNGDEVYYSRCIENRFNGKDIFVENWEEVKLTFSSAYKNRSLILIRDKEILQNIYNLQKVYKIKNLKINNFRLFDKLEITFNQDINVIIANNGAGKTTILDAISIGFGAMLTKFPNIDGLTFKKSDLRINNKNKLEPFTKIMIESTQNLLWDRVERRDSTQKTDKLTNNFGLKELNSFVESIIDSENDDIDYEMPLIIYYGTNRAVFNSPMRKTNFKKSYNRFESLNATLKSDTNFHRLFQWFDAMEDLERREQQKKRDFDYKLKELISVREAIEKILPNYQNPRIETRPLRFMIDRKEENGTIKELRIEQLSDGYRTVLAMVMDISSRMSEANLELGNSSQAIIMIDELDLHLHPKWQQTILWDLKRTFPNAQFIITTHSPQILSTVKKEHIFILENGKIKRPFDTPYGKRSVVALEDLMNTSSMPPKEIVEEVGLFNIYFEKIRKGDIESIEVVNLRRELEEVYGHDYQQLQIADMIINKYKALNRAKNG